MLLFGQLRQNKNAAGSIIGATFLALILLSGFTFYNLYIAINDDYQDLLLIMNQLDLQRKQENLEFVSVSTTSENKLNLTIQNTGSHLIRLIWLGIFDETTTPNAQKYYEISVGINLAEIKTNIPEIAVTILEGQERVIQIVTELGNTFNCNYPTSEEDDTQSSITITGINCTSTYNPSQWNTLGSTQLVSGSTSDLNNNDSNYAIFQSYWTGTTNDINDFVDNNTSNVDLSVDIGTQSNFSAQQYGPDGIIDVLLENDTGEGAEQWISPTGYEDPGWSWNSEPDAYDDNTGTYAWTWISAHSWSEYLVLTHSAITCSKIQYLIRRQNANIDQFEVDIYDGSWTNVYSGAGTWQTWTNVSFTETSMTKMRFRFYNSHSSQFRWVIVSEADFLQNLNNYELDLEVQWTNVDFDEANEWLCIYGGTMSAEDVQVDIWYGGSWQTILSDLANGWQNISVSPYLDSSIFTIRFKDGTISGDTTQSNWEIDVVLLHVWTNEDEYTAEVEFTGLSSLEEWTQLVWQIDTCCDISAVTVTIQFYNNSLGGYMGGRNGYFSYISDITPNTDELKSQTITSNLDDFKNTTGYWKVKITGVKSTSTQFQMKIDWIILNASYSSTGQSIPYSAWHWFTITARTASSNPIPYAFASIYGNGTSLTLQNASDGQTLSNPCWVRLDSSGKFHLNLKSTSLSSESFTLYVVVGSTMASKHVTQEVP
jgi:hypothetical protein